MAARGSDRTPPMGDVVAEIDSEPVSLVRRRLTEGFVAAGVACLGGLILAIPSSGPGGSGSAVVLVLGGVAVALFAIAGLTIRRVGAPVVALSDRLAETRAAYDRARLDARVDPLTGLGNHRAFQEELMRQVAECQRDARILSIVVLDLDDLKRTNDTQGHAAGDELLIALGRLVSATIRASDRSFRIGGDEFTLLMPDTTGEAAYAVVRRLLASATGGHPVLHGTPRFSFSAGIATYPEPSGDARRLIRHADAALYWAKRHGRTDIQLFDPFRHGAAGDERSTAELAEAVAAVASRRALRPVYQPIVSLSTGRPIGYEGLVRPSADSGFANAEALFSAAEVADRIVELDMAAIETVVGHVEGLLPGQYLSINMSPRTLETEQFHVGELIGVLRRYGLVPSQVVLELTEREAIEDMARLKTNLQGVRAAGIRIAADDVGAGNAGLRLLSQIPFDIVKVDLSLVQRGVLQESSLAVLGGLREMADRWGATIVAEGVQTPEQLVAVRHLGIGAAQGFLLGRPMEHADAVPVDIEAIAQLSNIDAAALAS